MARLLVVTNDYPPRPGGIQSFVHGVVSRLPADEVVVLTSRWKDWEGWDAAEPYRIVRHDTSVLLPTAGVRRHAVSLLREHGCTDVWFGAAAPLGLLASPLRAAGATRIVATTHGHEIGWAALPAARMLLRRIASNVDVMTYLGEYTRVRLAKALGPDGDRLRRLAPAVDTELFRPDAGGAARRAEIGLTDRPVIVCVSRLMPRKGQDRLIEVLPVVRQQVPGTALVLVGGGPSRERLEKLASDRGVADDVVFSGSVPQEQLPEWYGVGDVFAMPCRERLGGLDVEGLGMVFLEAAACGLPVVAGCSGGSVDAVVDGTTGRLVADDTNAISDVLIELLANRTAAAAMGQSGREWVRDAWSWESTLRAFRSLYPAI